MASSGPNPFANNPSAVKEDDKMAFNDLFGAASLEDKPAEA